MLVEQGHFLSLLQIVGDHLLDHVGEGDFGLPAEFCLGLAGVAEQGFDFSGPEVARVDGDDGAGAVGGWRIGAGGVPPALFVDALPLPADRDAEFGGAEFDELADAVLDAGGDDEVIGLVLLEHEPLHADEVLGVSPVAEGIEVAHVEAVIQALADVGEAAGDLAGDEGFATARAFVIEEDTVAGIEAVGFAVVDGDPVGVELGGGVGAARVEGGGFLLRNFLDETVELGGAGLVEAGFLFQTENADGFEQAQGADGVDVGGVFGAFEADGDVALGAEVVDFVGLDLLNDADEVAGVGEIAVVQLEPSLGDMGILINVVDALGVERGGAPLDAVDNVAFFEQEFGEVGAILTGDAGDEGDFGLIGNSGHDSYVLSLSLLLIFFQSGCKAT